MLGTFARRVANDSRGDANAFDDGERIDLEWLPSDRRPTQMAIDRVRPDDGGAWRTIYLGKALHPARGQSPGVRRPVPSS